MSFIRGHASEAQANGAVVGLSGGLDSSVVAYLCAKSFDGGLVNALIMPSMSTPKQDTEDAEFIADKLGFNKHRYSIDPFLQWYPQDVSLRTLGNIKARIRMSLLYAYANEKNLIVVGTGDRSEHALGYFTKYGDGGVDIEPIGDLYKTEVRKLATWLRVPKRIIQKQSSPQLWQGQTAEGELGYDYTELDQILMGKRRMPDAIKEMIIKGDHKRAVPPICWMKNPIFDSD